MRALSPPSVRTAITTARNELRATEGSFGSVFSDIARLLWPKNTAANVAAITGCSVRMVEFYLAGTHDWSGDAIAALLAEIMRRHGARNLKITKRV